MITVTNIPERRQAVTAINNYDRLNGLNSSQRAKYERPLWAFIAAILPGSDAKSAMDTLTIQAILADSNIHVTVPAIYRALKVMTNLDYSIHPHRRNCGASCYDVVEKMGGIKRWKCSNRDNAGQPPVLYSFGVSQAKVYRSRRVFGLTVQVKPAR